MHTMIGTLAKEPTFLPASGDKPATAYTRLAENKRRFENGAWVDGETQWFDATFTGRNAEALIRDYAKGDRLLVAGDLVKHERETADGKTHRSNKLYVKHFGPDAQVSQIAIDRTRNHRSYAQNAGPTAEHQHGRSAEAVADQEQEHLAPAEPSAAAAPAAGGTDRVYLTAEAAEYARRIGQLKDVGRLTPDQSAELQQVGLAEHGADVWAEQVQEKLRSLGVPAAEALYLGSVPVQATGFTQALSWAEAEQRAAALQMPTVTAQPSRDQQIDARIAQYTHTTKAMQAEATHTAAPAVGFTPNQ